MKVLGVRLRIQLSSLFRFQDNILANTTNGQAWNGSHHEAPSNRY